MKERSSNIELLRVLAMMAIVLGHCLRQNDCLLAMPNAVFASGMLRIAVNVFLIVGCWFMVDATFSWKRVFSLYRTLAFYSIPISVLMFFVNSDASLRLVLRGGGNCRIGVLEAVHVFERQVENDLEGMFGTG